MIVKDEEATLARCLNCVLPFADEIIIVDTGSTDNTVSIAKKFTDKLYGFGWCDDFAAARNYSFSKASCDLVMWLDADDIITAENAQKIAALKEADFDVAMLQYAAAFDGDNPTFVYYRERIFRRALNLQWKGAVHEVITPAGRVIHSDACIYHKKVKAGDPKRNLAIYQARLTRGLAQDSREKFYYGRELFFNRLYVESIAVLTDFLNGGGWVENEVEACRTIYKAYRALGREREGINALLKAFTLSYPRAEDCCILGAYFEDKKDVRSAIFWYKSALSSPEKAEDGGFVNVDYLTFIPSIRLCVLYDGLGEYKLAEQYNELAGMAKPNDASYLHNKKYFKTKNREVN
ncbi:MAG: glycosyltransferase family 2 protein [Clostridia bacterium]|nr:glycosyltransferase family 2 protein [Clostridia bacterium]